MPPSLLADPLYERLLRSFPADQAYTSADWSADALPGPVHHYLDHLLRHRGEQEAARLRRARTDWVNYDHSETEQATQALVDTIKDHTQVPQDQWAETLRTATHRTTEYLVRPVPTLTAFVFEEAAGAVPVSQIQWRMRFFGPYSYLRDAVQAFATKRNREALERGSFEQVLQRVDERMTADFDADRWLRLLDPLFEMADRATDHRQIPLSLLRTFFEEKNISRIADRLATHQQDAETDAVSPETLRRLIDAVPTDDPSRQRDAPESPLDADDFRDPASVPSTKDSEASTPDESADGPAPMWKQFEQNLPRRSGETTPGQDGEGQPLWAQFQKRTSSTHSDTDASPSSPSRSQSDQSMSDPSPSESSSASPNEDDLSALERAVFGPTKPPKRSVYIQKLFHGDEEAYRRALERLRTTESWSEASQVIASDVFRAHQVNIYSDAAVHFTNAVEAAFKE